MTDDELLALTTRINRIESSMITFRSFYPDDPVTKILHSHYADLTRLRAQIDTALGLPKPSTPPSSAPTTAD